MRARREPSPDRTDLIGQLPGLGSHRQIDRFGHFSRQAGASYQRLPGRWRSGEWRARAGAARAVAESRSAAVYLEREFVKPAVRAFVEWAPDALGRSVPERCVEAARLLSARLLDR